MNPNVPENEKTDVLEKGIVQLALYLLCGLFPMFGFPTGILLSLTSYANAGKMSARMIMISSVVMILWTAVIIFYLVAPILSDIF